MRILLTGEKGYIGTRLAQWLSGKANIAAVRRLSLRDETWESRDFSGIDGIVHLAALVHRKEKPEHEAD
jgi:UDP-glucose 4-epimerase